MLVKRMEEADDEQRAGMDVFFDYFKKFLNCPFWPCESLQLRQ